MATSIKYNPKKRTYTGTNGNDVLDASLLDYEPVGKTNISKNRGLTISGGNGNDEITGTDYNDTIKGGNGDDTIEGDFGADTITGGAGKTIINYTKGHGNDVINLTKGEQFILNLKSISNISELKFEYANKNKDLRIYTSKTSNEEYITLKNFASKDVTNNANTKKGVADSSYVQLVIGGKTYDLRTSKNITNNTDVVLYKTTLGENAKNFTGTWLNDEIDTSSVKLYKKVKEGKNKVTVEKDVIDTGLTIKGGSGNDTITGTKYSDKIYGNKGDDIINAGTGNNYIYFSKGDGNDVIKNGNGVDTLVFAKGTKLTYEYNNNDLIIRYSNNDSVTLQNYYSDLNSVKYIKIGSKKQEFNPPEKQVKYTFNKGDGEKIIYMNVMQDLLYFNNNIDDITFSWSNNNKDLILSYNNNSDNVKIKNFNTDNTSVYIHLNGQNKDILLSELIKLDFKKFNPKLVDFYYSDESDIVTLDGKLDANAIDFKGGNDNITNNIDGTIALVAGGDGDDTITNNGKAYNLWGGKGNNTIINNGTADYILGREGKNTLTNNGVVREINCGSSGDIVINNGNTYDIFSGEGNDTITNNGNVHNIYVETGDDTVIINKNSSTNLIYFEYDDGHDTLYLNASVNLLSFGFNVSFEWLNNDLIIKYPNGQNNATIKNYNPDNKDIIVKISTPNNEKYTDLATLVPEKPTTQSGDNNNENNPTDITYDDSDIYYKNDTTIMEICGENSDDIIINNGTVEDCIDGANGNDTIINNGTIGCQLWGGAGDDTIINNGNAGDEICGGRGNDTITTGQNSSLGRFLFDPGDGNDTLYLNAKVNNLDIFNKSADIVKLTDLTFNWNNEDLIIGYNNNLDSITIKNYCPDDQNIIVNICVGWNNSGGIYTDLATLVPEKTTSQSGDNNNETNSTDITFDESDIYYKNDATVVDIYGENSDDIIINNGTVDGYIYGNAGNDVITNNCTVKNSIIGGTGDDIITTGENSSKNYIEFNNGDGDDILYLNASVNYLYFPYYAKNLNYFWSGNDLIIKYNDEKDSVTIKNYNPLDNIAVKICNRNYGNYDLATLIPDKNIVGTDEDDELILTYANKIDGMGGNDNITNDTNGTVNYISGGDGDDTITNNGTVNTICGNNGDDTIINNGTVNNFIYCGTGLYDAIENYPVGNNTVINEGIVDSIIGGHGNNNITNNGTVSLIQSENGSNTIINNGTIIDGITCACISDFADSITNKGSCYYIYSYAGSDTITNYGSVTGYIGGGEGNDTITNYGSVTKYIIGDKGNDIITTTTNSCAGYIFFTAGDGNDTLYLWAKVNDLKFASNTGTKQYLWNGNDVIIKYNNNLDSVTIKNFDGISTINIDGVDIRTLVPTKPKSMSLGTSNTRICELSAEVLAFTSSGSSDMQLNYSTPDTNDISSVMSEYTNTDLQNI